MTTTSLLPPPGHPSPTPPGPKPHRFTLAEYGKLASTGLFHDQKTMLIQGELFVMALPDPPHDTALNLTYEFLRATFPTGHHVRNQQSFDIGADSDPGPDLAVVAGSIRDYATRPPVTAILIVEVADSSLFMDTTTKAELYATAGVPDYWVIDLAHRELIVFRDPVPLPAGLGATAYRSRQTFGPADSVAPLAAPTG